jgi:hypothetical protein
LDLPTIREKKLWEVAGIAKPSLFMIFRRRFKYDYIFQTITSFRKDIGNTKNAKNDIIIRKDFRG